MANTMKKLFAFLIAMVMVLSMIPAVSATENETETVEPGSSIVIPTDEEWVTINSADDWDALFGGAKSSAFLTDAAYDEVTLYVRLAADITLTKEETQYIGVNSPATTRALFVDLGGHTITYNKVDNAVDANRCFGIYKKSSLTMCNGTIVNNAAYAGASGGVFFLNGASSLLLADITIRDTNDTNFYSDGKIINNAKGNTTTLTNVTIEGLSVNNATVGEDVADGALITSGGTLNMTDCHFSASETSGTNNGGILNLTAGTVAEIENCTFTNGAATNGGQVYIGGTTDVTLTGCTFTNGSAAKGGAIYIDNADGDACTIKNSTIDGTATTGGGGIRKEGAGPLVLENSKISGTVNNHNGGGLYLGTGTVTMNGGSIDGSANKTTSGGNGGAVFLGTTSCSFILNSGKIDGTTAKAGIDIYIQNGRFIQNGGEVGKYVTIRTAGTADGTNKDMYHMYGGKLKASVAAAYSLIYSGYSLEKLTVAACSSISEEPNADGYYVITHNDVEDNTTTTAATCTEDGTKTIICATCEHTYTYALPATGHTPVTDAAVAPDCETTGLTEGSHCEICGEVLVAQEEVAATGHAWDEGEVTTKPDCENEGVKTYTCSNCGETKTEAVEATGHTPVTDAAVAPSCETTGLTEGSHCEICGEVLVAQEEVAATGHAWDEGKVTTEPDCENEGVKTYTCSNCGETKTEAIAATGHTPVTDAAVAPDCETTGLTEGSHCEICGEVLVAQEEVAATGHAWGEGEVTTEPDCENEGVKTYTCSNCGETKTETVEATGHEFGEEVYNEETKKFEKVCGVCGKIESREPTGITITEQPVGATAEVGATQVFSVAAAGEGQLTYLWKYQRPTMVEENKWYDWAESSQDATSIEVSATAARNGYNFKCVITDAYGNTVETDPVTLTVNTDDAIVINTQPAAQDKTAGETAVFSVTATGEDLTYLWQYRREADGAWYYWSNPSNDATSIEVGATVARNGYEFRCVITDANGVEKITEEVTLTVNAKELTTTVIANGAVMGETFSMDVVVSEAGEYTYLWKYQRPSMVDSDTWYYWAQPKAESGMTGKATVSRVGYRFKCVITDAYGNEMVTDIYELQADGSLTKVN